MKPANENPDFGKVCEHGQLKRKCYYCDLEEQVDSLTKERDELKKLAGELWKELQRWHGKSYEHVCRCCELQERAEKILGIK